MVWPGCKLFSRWSPPGSHISIRRFFFQHSTLYEICPKIWQISWTIDIPRIIDAFLFLTSKFGCVVLDTSMYSMEWGMIPLLTSKVWLWNQRDGSIWSFLTWTRSHLSLPRHPETSLTMMEEILLILQENQYNFLLELVDVVTGWMFSGPDLLQWFWFLRLEKHILPFYGKYHVFRTESFRVDFRYVHCLQLLKVWNQYVTVPHSRPYRAYLRNNPGNNSFPNWWILDLSFEVFRWYATNEPNGIIGPLNDCPKSLS